MSDYQYLLVIDRLIERLEGPMPTVNRGSIGETFLLQLTHQERNYLTEYLNRSRNRNGMTRHD